MENGGYISQRNQWTHMEYIKQFIIVKPFNSNRFLNLMLVYSALFISPFFSKCACK